MSIETNQSSKPNWGDLTDKLIFEWDFEKNMLSGIDILKMTGGSHQKADWKCQEHGHEWNAAICNRVRGSGCPVCSNSKILIGYNDFASSEDGSLIMHEWDYEINDKINIKPTEVTRGSPKKVNWICIKGHKWKTAINDRTNKKVGCPYCGGKRAITGVNDLNSSKEYEHVMREWNYEKNEVIGLNPKKLLPHSNKKAHWKCISQGHEWTATIQSRTDGKNGCSICSNKTVLAGYNDLASSEKYSNFMNEWDYTKNDEEGIFPTEITAGSRKKVNWKCLPYGHQWSAIVYDRLRKNTACSVCSSRTVLPGYNDLASSVEFLHLLAEWDYEKNDAAGIYPEAVLAGSHTKAHWKCDIHSHEWKAEIRTRTTKNGLCPKCSVSRTERLFMEAFSSLSGFKLETERIELDRSSRVRSKAQIDGHNKDLMLAIEYDGEWAHGYRSPSKKTYDEVHAQDCETTEALLNAGYRVIRIRQHSPDQKLPHLKINIHNLSDPTYSNNLLQVTYKSFGKDSDVIDDVAKMVFNLKTEWFRCHFI